MTAKRPARKRPAPSPASAPKTTASIPMSAVEKVEFVVLDCDGDQYGESHDLLTRAEREFARAREDSMCGPYRMVARLTVDPYSIPPSADAIAEAWAVLRRAGVVE